MGKIRVYELAKELGMESKDVIRRLGKMGAEVKNHMSTVDEKEQKETEAVHPKKTAKDQSAAGAKKERHTEKTQKEQPQKAEAKKVKAKAKPAAAPEKEKTETLPKQPEKGEVSQKTAPAAPAEDVKKETVKKAEDKKDKEKAAPKAQTNTVPEKKTAAEQPRQQGVFAKLVFDEDSCRLQAFSPKITVIREIAIKTVVMITETDRTETAIRAVTAETVASRTTAADREVLVRTIAVKIAVIAVTTTETTAASRTIAAVSKTEADRTEIAIRAVTVIANAVSAPFRRRRK